MADYIKREDILRILTERNAAWNAYTMVAILPAADVVERKRGKWIVLNDEYVDNCKCSECGCIEYFNKGWKRFNYCPNCGADMRVEDIPMEYFESGGK